MEVTGVRISRRDEEKLKAFASIELDDCFVVRGLKVILGNEGKLFVAMPARRRRDGTFQDIAHPIHQAARNKLERAVLEAYALSDRFYQPRQLAFCPMDPDEDLELDGVGARLRPPPVPRVGWVAQSLTRA